MIPRTFPSTFAANGQQQMVVYSLPSITGLTAWIDYIPVKGVTTESATLENTYANGGYQVVDSLASLTGKQAWLDYIPVYEDASYTKPWSTDAGGYIPTSALAALLLDFTSGRLDPRITFSRTTNATLTNSAGLVANAPMNLLTFSEQFDNAYWSKTTGGVASAPVITANAGIAPDGTTTADQVVFNLNGGTTSADISSIAATAQAYNAGVSLTQSVYLKTTDGTSKAFTYVNIDGTTSTITATGVWQRFTATVTPSAGGTSSPLRLRLRGSESTASSASIYMWGAQLELGSTATTYNPTTVKNLLGYTEHFDNAAWTKSNTSISATKVDDIYGQPFAQKLVEDTANSTHRVLNSSGVTVPTVGPTTYTLYAKAAERTSVRFTDNEIQGADFNLLTGVVSNLSAGVTATAADAGNGWWRLSVTRTSSSGTGRIVAYLLNAGTTTYTGDGTSGIYIFGAQLSDSASVDPYVYQPVAAPTSTAYYGPRFDYDPVTLQPKGLLIEEQRTNLLLNTSVLGTQVVTVTAVAHTLSFYGTGTIVLSGAATGTVVGTGAYPTRTTLTFTPIVGVLTVTVTGSVTSAQLEAGAFATSYIPTVASQVTRAADSASMIGNNFARWYNVGEGTVYSQFAIPFNGTNMAIWQVYDTLTSRWGLNVLTDNTFSYDFSTGSAGSQTGFARGVSQKVSVAIKAGTTPSEAANGVLATSTGAFPVSPAPTSTFYIGSRSVDLKLSGTISRIAYYNRRLSNTELQGITS